MAEKMLTARVFLHDAFDDTEASALYTSGELPNSGWTQFYTKGSVSIVETPEVVEVGNDQIGTTNAFFKSREITVTIPFSQTSFDLLAKYANIDPNYVSSDSTANMSDNSGVQISGISALIYDKGLDSANETDTPNPSSDDLGWAFYKLVSTGATNYEYNGDQVIVSVEFKAMAYMPTSSSTAKGMKAKFGTLTLSV